MSEEQQYRIPNTIRHDDFRAAIKPLLDLIGVNDMEVYEDLHITGAGRDSMVLSRISLSVATRPVEDDAELPEFEALQEYGELSQHVTIEVIP